MAAVTPTKLTSSGEVQSFQVGDFIPVASGGTGATTAAAARTSLGTAASGANSDITSLSGLTTPLTVAQGGTGVASFTSGGVFYASSTTAIGYATGSNGNYLSIVGGVPTFVAAPASTQLVQSWTNQDTTTVAGAPVYLFTTAGYKKAKADALGTAQVVGLQSSASVANAAAGNIVTGNGSVISLATALWDAVTGATGGLVAGTKYYLDPATAGKLTTTAPSTAGQFNVLVGIGYNTTDMVLVLRDPRGL